MRWRDGATGRAESSRIIAYKCFACLCKHCHGQSHVWLYRSKIHSAKAMTTVAIRSGGAAYGMNGLVCCRLLLSYERHVRGQDDRPLPTPYLRPSKVVRRRRHRSALSSYSVAKPPSPPADSETTVCDGPPTDTKPPGSTGKCLFIAMFPRDTASCCFDQRRCRKAFLNVFANYCDECACVCVCPSVCPRGYLRNHTRDLYPILCMLPMTMARSSSGVVAMRCILPVLWMTFFL